MWRLSKNLNSKTQKPANVIAEFTYQTCDDRVCLAPESLEFEKTIAGSAVVKTEENKEDVQNVDSYNL
jgi:thiol:disulfide interchange protein DsbD